MLRKVGAALVALVTLVSATFPSPYVASFDVVPMIRCSTGLGSGVRVSDDTVITAAHVASMGGCAIGGNAVETVLMVAPDFAAMQGDLPDGFRAIHSCEGIIEGVQYLGIGYADGGHGDVEPLIGTSQRWRGLAVLKGHVYHGHSGGAVAKLDGTVVAIINAMGADKPYAFVTPLSETYLCRSSIASARP